MADDVMIRFSADTDDLEDGLANVRGAVGSVTPDLKKLSESVSDAAQKASPATAAFSRMSVAIGDGLTGALRPASAALGALGDDAGAAKTLIDGEIKALQESLAIKKTIFDGEAKLKNINEGEKIALVRAATQEEYEAQRALLEQEAGLADQSLKQKEQALSKIATLEATHQKQMLQLAYQAAEEQDKIWQGLASKMGSSMSSSIMGLLQHTTTFREGVRQMAVQATQYFVNMGTQWVASFAMNIAKNIATHVMGEQAMTAATQLGVSERTASEAAGSVADIAGKAAAVIKSIMASSAEAFAGVFGFMAPLLGPAAAAQATVAGAASIASFDIGAWNIPQDQLAMVHKNELVMTASQGEVFRNLVNNGGARSDAAPSVHAPVNFHVHALDAQGVASFLQGNGREIMKAVGRHVQDGLHLGVRGLNPT
ncbi:MAG TPA: hypothetical protein VIF61_06285 [Methylocystis sp.]